MAEFDSASLLYLVPLTLHALAALSFFTQSVTHVTYALPPASHRTALRRTGPRH